MTDYFDRWTNYSYDANSRFIRKNLANGTYTTYSYNSRGFLTGISHYKSNGTLITYATYTYDAVGNRLTMTTSEGAYSYVYDTTYRLIGEVNPIGGTYSYVYDAVGNRLSMTHNGQTTNYTYDGGNKLLQSGTTTYTYDSNGNMLTKTESGQTTTYVYNYEDKMVGVNLPGGTSIVYSYDHEGKRIGKTAGGATVDYYLDGDYVIMEAQGASVMVYYTQGQGLISQRRGSSSYFYHYDGLGSTKALTDANQNTQASYIYDAWGNILQTNGTIVNPYIYVGELGYYADGDTGMYLLTQRWYNPIVGRFVARDPLERGNMNAYVYANDGPTERIDPTGLHWLWDWCIKIRDRSTARVRVCIGLGCHGDTECPSEDPSIYKPIPNPGPQVIGNASEPCGTIGQYTPPPPGRCLDPNTFEDCERCGTMEACHDLCCPIYCSSHTLTRKDAEYCLIFLCRPHCKHLRYEPPEPHFPPEITYW